MAERQMVESSEKWKVEQRQKEAPDNPINRGLISDRGVVVVQLDDLLSARLTALAAGGELGEVENLPACSKHLS